MRKTKGIYLFRAGISKTVSHHHLHLARDTKTQTVVELCSGKQVRFQQDWSLLAWGICRWVHLKWDIL
jgi:hypothetical protein